MWLRCAARNAHHELASRSSCIYPRSVLLDLEPPVPLQHVLPSRTELDRIATVLLRSSSSSADLARAASDLYACLSAPVADIVRMESRTSLPNGLALGPSAAAACTKEPLRTAVFLRGVDAALTEALRRFPGETVEVVYAGTGPLAPLVIPLLPRYANAPVRFTFIDVHADSVEATRVLAEHFDVARSIRAFVVGDATRYEHPKELRLHGLISETMQSALRREPQVAIARQILPQLVPGGFMVPESVRVDLLLGDFEARTRESRDERDGDDLQFVQTIFDLRAGVERWPLDADGCLPPVLVTLPADRSVSKLQAFFGTVIVTYGAHVLASGQSGLTLPGVVLELQALQPGRTLEFRYQVGLEPRFLVQQRS